jgi:hypothetical protein
LRYWSKAQNACCLYREAKTSRVAHNDGRHSEFDLVINGPRHLQVPFVQRSPSHFHDRLLAVSRSLRALTLIQQASCISSNSTRFARIQTGPEDSFPEAAVTKVARLGAQAMGKEESYQIDKMI